MSHVLVLFAYPAFERSRVQRRLVEVAAGLSGITFRDLHEAYHRPPAPPPLEQTSRLCGMEYLPPFLVYGTHRLGEERIRAAAAELVHTVRKHLPTLRILARAIDRPDAYALLDAGVTHVYRETFDTSLRVGVDALRLLGRRAYPAERMARAFRRQDEEAPDELRAVRGDRAAYLGVARRRIADLEQTLLADLTEEKERDAAEDVVGPLWRGRRSPSCDMLTHRWHVWPRACGRATTGSSAASGQGPTRSTSATTTASGASPSTTTGGSSRRSASRASSPD